MLDFHCTPYMQGGPKKLVVNGVINPTRWAPSSYKWSYNPSKWPYKWLTVLITLVIRVINPVITGRGPTLYINIVL